MGQRLTLRGVSYSYPLAPQGEAPAVNDVSIELVGGEILCIAGRNGSGKSTLAQICAGLLIPSSGTVIHDGKEIRSRRDRLRLRRKVGLLFQSPEDQLFADTVEKDIGFGPVNLGVRGAELEEKVRAATALVGLPPENTLSRSPFSLSHGEQRKVALAGVLAMEPDILILDEPFIGLDCEGRMLLSKSLSEYRDRSGCSMVIVTHELAEVWQLAERFVLLEDGRLAESRDRTDLLMSRGALEALGLHLPQWAVLAGEIHKRGIYLEDPSLPACLAEALMSLGEVEGGR